jgi:hypothetical protein
MVNARAKFHPRPKGRGFHFVLLINNVPYQDHVAAGGVGLVAAVSAVVAGGAAYSILNKAFDWAKPKPAPFVDPVRQAVHHRQVENPKELGF